MDVKPIAIVLAAFAIIGHAQKFEVASIKPSGPQSQRGEEGGPGSPTPGRYVYNRARLSDLIAVAYHLDYEFQISSKAPLDRYFDVAAKVPVPATREQFRTMLAGLLAERFHLRQHIESREFAGYELVVGKTGPKLNSASPAGRGFPDLRPGRPGLASMHTVQNDYPVVRLRAQQEPMSVFARSLRLSDGLPVVDKTGLTGAYDFTLEYSLDLPNSAGGSAGEPSGLPTLLTAIQQQLGLRLVSRKIPFPVVVVESVDRTPTEN